MPKATKTKYTKSKKAPKPIGELAQLAQIGGNTSNPNLSPVTTNQPKDTKTRAWFMTWNNHPTDFLTILQPLEDECEKCAYQEETGENGTPHIQGCFYFKNARHFSAMKQIHRGIHWEKCKDILAGLAYCTKEDTRTGIIRFKNYAPEEKLIDPMEGVTIKPWQQQILDIIKTKPDRRTVNWFWDARGGTGKTSLAIHICMKHHGLLVGGKALDVKCAVAKWVNEKKPFKVIIWNIPRSLEHCISFDAIESVKDGAFFSGKYESDMVMFNPVHVFCFSNFPPPTNMLSNDRWNIVEINE